jgi:CBS domain containing-hemolysin-like protein
MTSLFLFCACLLVSFLYAGIEAGLLSVDRVRLRSRVAQREKAALRLDRLLARPERLLTTVLLVTNFADVAALVLVTNAMAQRFGRRGIFAAGILMLPVYLLGVQLLPKTLFRRFPYRALAALAGLLEATVQLLSPLLTAGGWVFRRYAKPGAAPARHQLLTARDEFRALANEGKRTGALNPAAHRLMDHVLDFSALRAQDLLTPAPAPLVARPGLRVADLLEFAREHRLDYLPVVRADSADLLALVDVFALLFDRNPQRDAFVAYLSRPLVTVAPDEAAPRVLTRLRGARLNAAAVLDGPRLAGIIRTRTLLLRLVRGSA